MLLDMGITELYSSPQLYLEYSNFNYSHYWKRPLGKNASFLEKGVTWIIKS
jgi:hypothetical protein